MTADLAEGDAVAAVVAARLTKSDGAAVEDLSDNGGDFANAVILLVVADIEDLVVHCFAWRLQGEDDRLSDVLDMDQQAPRSSVAGHPNLLSSPREPGQVVEDNVERMRGLAPNAVALRRNTGEK